jgi:hypothetical protein
MTRLAIRSSCSSRREPVKSSCRTDHLVGRSARLILNVRERRLDTGPCSAAWRVPAFSRLAAGWGAKPSAGPQPLEPAVREDRA